VSVHAGVRTHSRASVHAGISGRTGGKGPEVGVGREGRAVVAFVIWYGTGWAVPAYVNDVQCRSGALSLNLVCIHILRHPGAATQPHHAPVLLTSAPVQPRDTLFVNVRILACVRLIVCSGVPPVRVPAASSGRARARRPSSRQRHEPSGYTHRDPDTHTHTTHTQTHACLCVCVCVCARARVRVRV
jgi:hypothetical protein